MEIVIRSDYPNMSREWHFAQAQDLFALCELIGVSATETGVHGSTPFVRVEEPDQMPLGIIYHFKVVGHEHFLLNFDPTLIGLEFERYCPLEGWIVVL